MPALRVERLANRTRAEVRSYDAIVLYAGGDMEFANWLRRLEWICWRFMQVSFFDIDDLCEERVAPIDGFAAGIRPEKYFGEVVLSVLQEDLGCMDIECLLFESVMWGEMRGH